jgi:hypothetical protein
LPALAGNVLINPLSIPFSVDGKTVGREAIFHYSQNILKMADWAILRRVKSIFLPSNRSQEFKVASFC